MLSYEEKIAIQKAIQDSLGYSPSLYQIEEAKHEKDFKRFPTAKRNRNNGFFIVHRNKRGNVYCNFGDFSRAGEQCFSWSDNQETTTKLTDRQKREIREELNKQRTEAEEEQKKAIKEHESFFNSLPYADDIGVIHPYLKAKCLQKSYIAKYNKENDSLLFPMTDSTGHFTGYQSIPPVIGQIKKIAKGSKKKGSFYPLQFKDCDMTHFYACEGFATGLSILEATRATVIVCIDCGNLTEGIRSGARYLNISPKKVCIVADNDKNQAGEEGARKAASQLGCHYVVIPEEGMDANDYHSNFGIRTLTNFLKEVEKWPK